jgi:hypothetical protein
MRTDFERCRMALIEQTKEYIELCGGWREFYTLGEERSFWNVLKDEAKKLGPLGFVTAFLRETAGYGEVIRTHGNGAYFLHYAYISQPHGIFDPLFTRTGVTKGAVNRLPYVVEIVEKEYLNHDDKTPFEIANLGGGFGFLDNIIAGICPDVRIHVSDINEDVLEKGKKITSLNGVSKRIDFMRMEALEYVRTHEPKDVLITMGIIDYLERQAAVEFLSELRKGIKDSGCLIATAVGPTRMGGIARKFGLCPVYRTRDEVYELLDESGYREIDAFMESTGTNTIAKALK